MMARQHGGDAGSEPEDVPPAAGQRRMEYSVPKDLPYIMMDGPNSFGTLESLEQYLADLQAMPDFIPKELLIEQTKWFIARKKQFEAERKDPGVGDDSARRRGRTDRRLSGSSVETPCAS